MISPIPSKEPVQQKGFYSDSNKWHNGLFTVSHFGGEGALTYVLMRQHGENLILLIGSPKNILGNISAGVGIQMPDTSGGVFAFLSLFSGAYLNGADLHDEFLFPHELRNADTDEGNLQVERVSSRYAEEWWGFYGGMLSCDDRLRSDPTLYAQCMLRFCNTDISQLPVTPIETVFKVFAKWQVPRSVSDKTNPDLPFADVNCFCIGSPLFTAVP